MGIQIADLHISSKTKVTGEAKVFIAARKDATHAGVFTVTVNASFDPAATDYPTGSVRLVADLNEASKGTFASTSIDQINSWGKVTPTTVLTGKCNFDQAGQEAPLKGCRFWLLIANNKGANDPNGTPDVASFIVFDRTGIRSAYGTGPVASGDLTVSPSSD